VAVHLPST